MDCISTRLPYRQTGAFSKIVLDYIDQLEALQPFFDSTPTIKGIQKAIDQRKHFPANRALLVAELKKQYASITYSAEVGKNIEALQSSETFTVTTAHQPNIFTGPLYFIYKILHTIKLSASLNTSLPKYKFVPVYYMGSEDADLDELGHIWLGGEKWEWKTKQKGAVGRMKADKELLRLIASIQGQLEVMPFGKEVMALVKECFRENTTIQDAIFSMVNKLFGAYGLIVLMPDNAVYKKQMQRIFEDDLLSQSAAEIVEKTSVELGKLYKIQVNPREINLFYLHDDSRERIEMTRGDGGAERWRVLNSKKSFTKDEIINELKNNPERFSPNVVLRGIFQETILPNVVFTGGGGELAYWLQLKELFAHYKIPLPVLLLRNSFLVLEKKWQERITKLGFTTEEIFLPESELVNRLVARTTDKKLKLNGTFTETEQLYTGIKKQAAAIDSSLEKHVDSLREKTLHRLLELEKKMLRAEKRKFADQQRQIHAIKEHLFPGGGLQERHDNILFYYANWGPSFLTKLYENSLGLEQEFVIITEQ